MDYQKHYNRLIERSILKNRKRYNKDDIRYVYYEKHHIIPLCCDGTNKKDNLVLLTPEEHYLAHQLLVKIYPKNSGLVFAAVRMTMSPNGKRMNNKLYSWLRKRHSENTILQHKEKKCGMHGKLHSSETKKKMSENNFYNNGGKQLKGEDNPSYGLKRSDETRKKISEIRTGISTGKRTEETKAKMRAARKKQTKTRDMIISINGQIFKSATAAANFLDITASGLCKRMRTGKYTEYFYL